MKPVALTDNHDGTWTARIFLSEFTGSYAECLQWLLWNGEYAS